MNLQGYQTWVANWLVACFGEGGKGDRVERRFRFLEEALELVQAHGGSADDVKRMSDKIFSQPRGDTPQEVAGVIFTLTALADVEEIDLAAAVDEECERVSDPAVMAHIREKNLTKIRHVEEGY